MDPAFRQRLRSVGLDHDSINVIVRVVKRADMPTALGDAWAARWAGQTLQDLLNLSSADRQHVLVRHVDDFLQDSANLLLRITYAATQAHDADLRTTGELGVDLQDVLTAFGRDVMVPTVSPFTGKVRYVPLTDIDVATDKAIVEVSTQFDASGKVAQLTELIGSAANPRGLPVYHYFPNVDPLGRSAQSLRAAGSAGVYNDRMMLVAALRSLP